MSAGGKLLGLDPDIEQHARDLVQQAIDAGAFSRESDVEQRAAHRRELGPCRCSDAAWAPDCPQHGRRAVERPEAPSGVVTATSLRERVNKRRSRR